MSFLVQNDLLVTVLMPVYNSSDVYASVESVLEQTYGPIQFILIDDCSPGALLQNMEAYLEARAGDNIQSWTVMMNETNIGLVKTLNKGL